MEVLGIIIIILLGLLALTIGIYLLASLVTGAIILFAWATESGFIGVAAYFACWVFLFPIMLIGCIIVGIFNLVMRLAIWNAEKL